MLKPTEPKLTREQSLQNAAQFYEDTLKAVKGGQDLLELGYFPGKLARKIGPAIRALQFIEASTKEELKKISAELTAVRTVKPEVASEAPVSSVEETPNVE